ncbi:site-specific integrase [Streptomonospora sp. PA3]|uniref:tyrosine-type recombinase/integrase n=1 Tax=Streptomonospora sp. PA3 TaxID=2607326 RepID=UPI0012DDD80A|nr:tyrosine-type recombinase/integrase [Streptomonospora sp. PA3]MUL43084.1 site-specific integrase [Streptomonospora sp. PA3]
MAGGKKRSFGNVRQLASGRFQARYRGPDGRLRNASMTFATKKAAERWLTLKEAEIVQGEWFDPDAGSVRFAEYAGQWVEERDLAPRSADLYRSLLRLHLNPTFGGMLVKDIKESHVRAWRSSRRKSKVGTSTVAKAYRLLRAVMNTAVRDKLIRGNPCQLEGAGQEESEERPALSVAEVYKLADAVPPRYRALVLLAAFGSLRWGEAVGLRRRFLDLDARTVTVREVAYELGGVRFGPPKSKASRRTVQLPGLIADDLRAHLDAFANPGPDGLVFVGERGNPLRRANFSQYWQRARASTGLSGVRFHDLRHAGNTFAAEAGASLRELMTRMGHSSTRAALIYLHARDDRARELADSLGERAARELAASTESEDRSDEVPDEADEDGPDSQSSDGSGGPDR